MGKPGPAPTPTALRVLRGNPSKRPLNANEPRRKRGERAPTCPDCLEGPGRAEWRRLAPTLHHIGLLTPVDRGCFTIYCAAWGLFVDATKHLAEHGSVHRTPNGREHPSPWLSIQTQAGKTLHRMGCEFGLTPASRSRIAVEPKDTQDEFDAFLARRGGGGGRYEAGEPALIWRFTVLQDHAA